MTKKADLRHCVQLSREKVIAAIELEGPAGSQNVAVTVKHCGFNDRENPTPMVVGYKYCTLHVLPFLIPVSRTMLITTCYFQADLSPLPAHKRSSTCKQWQRVD